ncbi:MAG: peptide maturation system acyl carrier-related protein [Clostridia bacterium]|nr:peptide maturation system acyl carrier-related protein [Clostridia bacterium]
MNKDLSYEDIRLKIKDILSERFHIDMNQHKEEDDDKELLGDAWGFEPRHLLYLFFDVEKNFGIAIPEKDIAEGKFNTINNIAAVIVKQIAQNKETA